MLIFTSRGNNEEEIFGDLDDVITLSERSAPPTPVANKGSIFLDTADGKLKIKKDDDTVVDLEGGGSGDLSEWSLFSAISDVDFAGFAALNVGFLRTVLSNPATAGLIRAGNNEILVAARNFLNTLNHGIKLNTSNKWEFDTHLVPSTDDAFDIGEFTKQFREIFAGVVTVQEIDVFDSLNMLGLVNGDLIPGIDDTFLLGDYNDPENIKAWASVVGKQIIIPKGGLVNADHFSLSAKDFSGIINVPSAHSVEFQEDGIEFGDIDVTGLFFPFHSLDVETIINRKSIFLLNFENDPILDGEFARNGADVKVMSGGLVRNLSNLGAAGSQDTWSAFPAIQDVDFAGFRGTNAADPTELQDLVTLAALRNEILELSDVFGLWDIGSAVFVQSFSVFPQSKDPKSLFFRSDGKKMYVGEGSVLVGFGNAVIEYDLSTPWDISTASHNQTLDLGPFSVTADALFFRSDGKKMYVILFASGSQRGIREYDLSTAWDVSTASLVRQKDLSTGSGETEFTGFFFRPDGKKLYGVGIGGDKVYEFDLATPWNVNFAVFLQDFPVVANPRDLFLREDGKMLYVIELENDKVYQYILSTPWDVSTASFDKDFSVAAQDTDPNGLFIGKSGSKMYHAGYAGGGGSGNVYEYDLI